jgi:hypothetical protein
VTEATPGGSPANPDAPQLPAVVIASELSAEEQMRLVQELSQANWIPRIQITQGLSDSLGQGIAKIGEFVYNQTTVMGEKFLAVAFASRPHALLLDDKRNVLMESFDPAHADFKTIQAKAAGPKISKERPMAGMDFLYWVVHYWSAGPDGAVKLVPHRAMGIFFFNKTAARHIPVAHKFLTEKTPIEFGRSLVESGGNKWYSPLLLPYRGPALTPDQAPTKEMLDKATLMFKNPVVGAGEDAPAPAPDASARPR